MEPNNNSLIPTETLADEIRTIYKSDQLRAETLIEAYLEQRLKNRSTAERITILQELIHKFKGEDSDTKQETSFEQKEFFRLISLFLGERISTEALLSTELSEKLAYSLNTIFDTLNQIIGVIHVTLLGEKEDVQTIRQIIGSNLQEESGSESLQDYLDQIQQAFLVSHRAFQQAAGNMVDKVLNELAPDHISAISGGSLSFGPFRKAGLFEVYKEKFQTCRGWFDSGRFSEELLREFEKTCQTLYKRKT
jgi:hypothetical protein